MVDIDVLDQLGGPVDDGIENSRDTCCCGSGERQREGLIGCDSFAK